MREVNFFSKTYCDYISIPSVSEAVLLNNGCVEFVYSQGALSEEKNVSFSRTFISSGDTYTSLGFPTAQASDIKMRQYSPSRKYLALVRKPKSESSASDLIEIWDTERLLQVIHCKNCGQHDQTEPICTDEFFGGLQWSPDENYLLFTTLRDRTKDAAPFYDKGRASKDYGKQYLFEESWGNSMDNIYYTSLWVAKVFSDSAVQVRKVPGIPPELNVAQPIWTPKSTGIVFVGQKRYLRRLGHIYCTNRAAALYHVNVPFAELFDDDKVEENTKVTILTENCEEDFASRCPSFSPDGSALIYHTFSSSYSHSSCSRLRKINWDTTSDFKHGAVQTVIDVVRKQQTRDEFPGIYLRSAPQQNNFITNTKTIFRSFWNSRAVLLIVDIKSGVVEVFTLGSDYQEGSLQFFDYFNGSAVISYSTPTKTNQFFVVSLMEDTTKRLIEGAASSPAVEGYLAKQKWELIRSPAYQDETHEIESILISPRGDGPFPLIAYPHGGPHSWTGAEYVGLYSYFVAIGYHVLLTNYRGSLGYGEDFVECLFANCGTFDTGDVMEAINHVCKMDNVDETRLVMGGGSHGGFIAGNLLGEYPERFKAGIMRNPVTNLASKVSGTDLPDSSVLVSVGKGDDNGFPGEDGVWQGVGAKEAGVWIDEERLMKMYKISPISKVHHVKAPTILVIGLKDLRVPTYQAKEFYYNLKSRGVKCEILAYDDPHAITQVHFAYDAWMNISLWLEEHVD